LTNLIRRGPGIPQADDKFLSGYQLGYDYKHNDLYIRDPGTTGGEGWTDDDEIVYLGGDTISGLVENKVDKDFVDKSLAHSRNIEGANAPGFDNKIIQDITYEDNLSSTGKINLKKVAVSIDGSQADVYKGYFDLKTPVDSWIETQIDSNNITIENKYDGKYLAKQPFEGQGNSTYVRDLDVQPGASGALITKTLRDVFTGDQYSIGVGVSGISGIGIRVADLQQEGSGKKYLDITIDAKELEDKITNIENHYVKINTIKDPSSTDSLNTIFVRDLNIKQEGDEVTIIKSLGSLASGGRTDVPLKVTGTGLDITYEYKTEEQIKANEVPSINISADSKLDKNFVNAILQGVNNGIVQDITYEILSLTQIDNSILNSVDNKAEVTEFIEKLDDAEKKLGISFIYLKKKIIHPDDPSKIDNYTGLVPFISADGYINNYNNLIDLITESEFYVVDTVDDLNALTDVRAGSQGIAKKDPYDSDGKPLAPGKTNVNLYYYADVDKDDKYEWTLIHTLSFDPIVYSGDETTISMDEDTYTFSIHQDILNTINNKMNAVGLNYSVIKDIAVGSPATGNRYVWTKNKVNLQTGDVIERWSGNIYNLAKSILGDDLPTSGTIEYADNISIGPRIKITGQKYKEITDYLPADTVGRVDTLESEGSPHTLFNIDLSNLIIDEGSWD
jgi:hypothetical protein